MELPTNKFKQALRQGRPQIGLWVGLADGYVAELLATVGFDCLVIDAEHAPNDPRSVLAQLQAMAPYPVHPIVRPVLRRGGVDQAISGYRRADSDHPHGRDAGAGAADGGGHALPDARRARGRQRAGARRRAGIRSTITCAAAMTKCACSCKSNPSMH